MSTEGDLGERADSIRELARERLGFVELRPGQLQAAVAASSGQDVLAVLPTGGGSPSRFRSS